MHSQPRKVAFELPAWVNQYASSYTATSDRHARMKFVIAAAMKNVTQRTGGPFAAAVFESDSGALVSLGTNLVMSQNLSILHAEIVAITLAQKKLGTYDLAGLAGVDYELIASTEPCVMCLGAIIWSGVGRIVTAASDLDARGIGFDEGPKPENWIRALSDRGIEVVDNIESDAARQVLQYYVKQGGVIYNSGQAGSADNINS